MGMHDDRSRQPVMRVRWASSEQKWTTIDRAEPWMSQPGPLSRSRLARAEVSIPRAAVTSPPKNAWRYPVLGSRNLGHFRPERSRPSANGNAYLPPCMIRPWRCGRPSPSRSAALTFFLFERALAAFRVFQKQPRHLSGFRLSFGGSIIAGGLPQWKLNVLLAARSLRRTL